MLFMPEHKWSMLVVVVVIVVVVVCVVVLEKGCACWSLLKGLW